MANVGLSTHDKTFKFRLLGACDCPNPSAISRAQIGVWEKEGIVEYLGETQDVRDFIASASCIVLPSYYKEGVPRILLEAMAMGKPIITTNLPGCKECVAPPLMPYKNLLIGQNGILIPSKDSKALSLAFSLFASIPIGQMGKNARVFVQKRFSISHILSSYFGHIKSIINAQNPSLNTTKDKQTTTPATKLKLAFVSNTSFSMYNFRLKVLQTLSQQGFAIHIIAPADKSTNKLQEQGFITHDINLNPRSLNPIHDLRTSLAIYKILKNIQPHLVFNYTIKPAIYASALCNLLGIPNIAIITGLGYAFIKSGFKKQCLHWIVCKMYQFSLKRTKEVWFLNTDDMQEFLSLGLIKQKQAFLLDSEGVDCAHFSPWKKKQKTASQSNEIIFLFIGRMLWDKGVGEFIEAARILKKDMKNLSSFDFTFNGGGAIRFRLLGACDCPNPSAISRAQIGVWEKEGIVEYLGETQDVRDFIASASCIVLPSYREGISMSLLESMAMGKAIITSNAIGCKDLLKPNYNGFICKIGDAPSLAKAMHCFLMLTPQERDKMGENARVFVQRKYNITRIIRTYTHAIQSLYPRE